MSGKDLLAVLAMIVPSFLLIAMIAFSLVPSADLVVAPRADQAAQAGAWETPQDAQTGQPVATARCNSSAREDDRSC